MYLVRPFELPVLASLTVDEEGKQLRWTVNPETSTRTDSLPFTAIYAISIVPTSISSPGTLHTPATPDDTSYGVLIHHIRTSTSRSVVTDVVEFRVWGEKEANELKKRILECAGLAKTRRVLAILNPRSGEGEEGGEDVFRKVVAPVFELAGLSVEVLVSEKPLKMMGTVRQMEDLTEYDAIAVCGGDGIVHEVVNGILTRSDWDVASKIPIIIIPAGKVNFQAKSLHLTHPLISAVSLLHPSPVPRTVLGLTTMSGLRVFSHSQVRWLPPPKFSHSWTSFLLSQRPDPNIPTRFGLHHFPPPSTSTEKTPRAAPPKRNQPGPPLHHPCLAPSSLPLGWNSAAFGSPLIVSAPPPNSAPYLTVSICDPTAPQPLPTATTSATPLPPPLTTFSAEALLVTFTPPDSKPLPTPKYGMNLRCLKGGKMIVDGELMEAGPFAAEAVEGAVTFLGMPGDLERAFETERAGRVSVKARETRSRGIVGDGEKDEWDAGDWDGDEKSVLGSLGRAYFGQNGGKTVKRTTEVKPVDGNAVAAVGACAVFVGVASVVVMRAVWGVEGGGHFVGGMGWRDVVGGLIWPWTVWGKGAV